MEHLTREVLEAFVTGDPEIDVEALRRHVSDCALCARRLAREARLEVGLATAAIIIPDGGDAPRWRHGDRAAWGAALGAAAGLLLVAGAVWVLARGGRPAEWVVGGPAPAVLVHDLSSPPDTMARMPCYTVVSPRDMGRFVGVPDRGAPDL